jgi:serine/threonine protein kinase
MEAQQSKWETVKSLFEAAQGIAPAELAEFLATRCQDKEVCAEVERLLREYREAESFLSTPAVGRISEPLEEAPQFSLGEILGDHFRIVEFIAAGGMGSVYKAEDLDLRRFVALKFVSVEAGDEQAQARLRREAQAASALNHPNICTIYEIGNHAGRAFIAMELLEGRILKQCIAEGPLDIDTILSLALEIADALDAAHSAGVFHRDIKPANIFITMRGHAKILDFGIATTSGLGRASETSKPAGASDAAVTAPGVVAGTSSYMSPEQVRGDALDARTDLFSLGVTLYEMTTGQLPFKGNDAAEVRRAVLDTDPPPASQVRSEVPKELEAIIENCLRRNREARYQRASDLSAALGALKRSRESGLIIAGEKRRTRWLASAMAVVVVAALGTALWLRMRPAHLTEKDSVVLADFGNTTGDPVFSEALKAGLLADLGQSPFLNILSEDEIAKQLRFMGRPAETPLTSQVSREVCRRADSKAMLAGNIASLGTHYAITLSASNCEDGSSLAVEQAEAKSREEVLSRLHDAARRLRSTLGESLASVQKHDIPLEQATTSSLEALQAFSQAQRAFRTQGETAAIPLFERALKLDPYFALALSDLGTLYCNLDETGLCARYASEAYALRDRVSERERFFIESNYFMYVTGELERAARVYEEWKNLYPRMLLPYVNMSLIEGYLGRNENALSYDLAAFAIRKDAVAYRNLFEDYMVLNRLDDAAKVLDQARAEKLDDSLFLNHYQLAFLIGDQQEMDRISAAATNHLGDESDMLASQADTEAYYGRLRKARELTKRAVQSALSAGSQEDAANYEATAALREAEFGNSKFARTQARTALSFASSQAVQIAAALAFARSGEIARARTLGDVLQRQSPADTLLINYWLPTIRAASALNLGNSGQALTELQVTEPYELGGDRPPFSAGATLYPVYLRGEAYLKQRQWAKAQAEFQKIIDHRGLVWNFPLGALARLQLARTCAASGDLTRARTAYKDYLDLWSQAEPDIPILFIARNEYASLGRDVR